MPGTICRPTRTSTTCPDDVRLHAGPFFIDGVEVTRENLAAAFADARRLRDDDDI